MNPKPNIYQPGTGTSFWGRRQSLQVSSRLIRRLDHRTTPYFQFDLASVRENIRDLKTHVRPDSLFYAVKCNSISRVLSTIGLAGCGFEINNRNEWQVLDRLGLSGARLINSSPVSSAKDVRFLFSKGVSTFCMDSRSGADNLSINAPGAEVVVRLYHGNQGCRFKLNRLGAAFEEALDLIPYARAKGLNPVGVTFHVGSQCSDSKSWELAIEKASRLFTIFPFLKILNLGGGFPVRYQKDVPTLESLGQTIRKSIKDSFDKPPVVYAEPGRYMVGNAAYSCASVIQVKEETPVSRAVVDLSIFSGFMEILEISDGFHYVPTVGNTGATPLVRYHIGGPTCAGTDVICKDILLPRLRVDYRDPGKSSRIYFADTGAYTLEYIARREAFGFNGAHIPKIYFTGEEANHGMAV